VTHSPARATHYQPRGREGENGDNLGLELGQSPSRLPKDNRPSMAMKGFIIVTGKWRKARCYATAKKAQATCCADGWRAEGIHRNRLGERAHPNGTKAIRKERGNLPTFLRPSGFEEDVQSSSYRNNRRPCASTTGLTGVWDWPKSKRCP
jgi:hypothetical protein